MAQKSSINTDGDLTIIDHNGNTIATFDGSTRTLNIPSGATLALAGVPVTAGGSSASLIHQASLTINNGDIQQLPSAAQQIAGSPGSDRLILFRSADLSMSKAGVTPYGGLDSGAWMGLRLGSGTIEISAYLAVTTDGIAIGAVLGGRVVTLQPFQQNDTAGGWGVVPGVSIDETGFDLPLVLYLNNNGAGNISGGDAGDELTTVAEFRVYDQLLKRNLTTDESGWNQTTRTFN